MDNKEIFSKYVDRMTKLNAKLYTYSNDEDTLLVNFWIDLKESGELDRLILPSAHGLRSFINIFKQPTALVYRLKENRIACAAWATPVDNCINHPVAHHAFWSGASERSSKEALEFTRLSYELLFEYYQAILSITWQPELLELHKKLGYVVAGIVPNLHDKELIYFVHLTKEAFFQSHFMKG